MGGERQRVREGGCGRREAESEGGKEGGQRKKPRRQGMDMKGSSAFL